MEVVWEDTCTPSSVSERILHNGSWLLPRDFDLTTHVSSYPTMIGKNLECQ